MVKRGKKFDFPGSVSLAKCALLGAAHRSEPCVARVWERCRVPRATATSLSLASGRFIISAYQRAIPIPRTSARIQQAGIERAATEGGAEQEQGEAARRVFCEVFAFTATTTGGREGRKEDTGGRDGTRRTSGGVGMRNARRSGRPRDAAAERDTMAEVQEGDKPPPTVTTPSTPPTGHP